MIATKIQSKVGSHRIPSQFKNSTPDWGYAEVLCEVAKAQGFENPYFCGGSDQTFEGADPPSRRQQVETFRQASFQRHNDASLIASPPLG